MDSALEELLSDARTWAATKGRMLDEGLLVQALDLRLGLDQLGDAYWPAGSVRHLMCLRYPVHGPLEAPAAADLVATLDAFWRFLRSTGRMSAASAQPAVLLAEAKAARRSMDRLCADPGNRTRREIFLRHNEKLAQAGPSAEPALAAACFVQSDLWQLLEHLRVWVGQGRELDADAELPIGLARELYRELGLDVWTGVAMNLGSAAVHEGTFGEMGEPVAWDPQWTRASECPALERLWWVAVRADLVQVLDGRVTVGRQLPEEGDGQGWARLALEVLLVLAEWASYACSLEPLHAVLRLLGGEGDEPQAIGDLLDFWITAASARLTEGALREGSQLAAAAEDFMACLAIFDDAGLWRREGELLAATVLGQDFASVLGHDEAQATDRS